MRLKFYLLFFIFCIEGLSAWCQFVIDNRRYNIINDWYRWPGGTFTNNLNIPKVTAVSGRDSGAIRYNIPDSSMYLWTGSQWRQVGSGSTLIFTNGITNSSGTVRLGGNLTQSTTLNGQSLYPFTLDNPSAYNVNLADGAEFNQYGFYSVTGTTSNLQQTHRKVDIDFTSSDGMFANYLFDKEVMELKVTKGGLISEFRMNGDSLYTQLNPSTKRWAFRNPSRAATDTSVNKPWTWNISTQRMEVLDGWPKLGLQAADTVDISSKVQASYKSLEYLNDTTVLIVKWNGTKDTLVIGGTSSYALNDLTDVILTSPATNDVLKYNGSQWVNGQFTPESGTYATKIAITSPSVGRQFYQTNGLEGLYTWDGVSWVWNFGGSFRNFFDFTDGTTGFQGGTFTSGGSLSRSVLADSVGGGLSIQTGTTSSGAAGLVYLLGTRNVGKDYGAYKYFTAARLIFNDSSTSSNRFIIRFGLSAAGASTYGENGDDLMFMYCDSINGGNWTVKNINSSGTTTHNINTGIFAQTKRIYHLLIVTDYQTGQHYCYVDNVLGATIPITDHNTLGSQLASIRKTGGTTSRSFVLRESYQFVKYKSQ